MVLQIKTMSRPLYKNQFEKQLKPVKKIKTNKATKLRYTWYFHFISCKIIFLGNWRKGSDDVILVGTY